MQNSRTFDPAVWRRNLQALERRDPSLAKRIYEAPLSDRYVTAWAADGSLIIGKVLENGQSIALCHVAHPREEAEQWAMNLGEAMRQNAHVLLLSFGAGHHPLALFRLSDAGTFIWIVEPDPALIKLAFHGMDFTDLIQSKRVQFAVGLPEHEVARLLFTGPGGNRMKASGIRLASTGVARQVNAGYLEGLKQAIQEAIQMERLKFKTSEAQGVAILQNVLANLPAVLRGAPWKRLIGAAPGVPAVVIAPGPSLEEAIPQLAFVRRRVLFFAVDTAHRILHQKGIKSDFVVSLDFTELNTRHFETIQRDEAMLLAFPGVHPAIPQKYESRTFFFNHAGSIDMAPGAGPLLASLHSLGGLGELASYGSTAHIAVHAARMMGCSPIILVGSDLSFPDEKWYAQGAMQNELHQPDRENETLLEVEANDGGTVRTSGLYKYYLDAFGDLIRGCAAPVVNTSPKGARIGGAQWMPLPEALSKFVRRSLDLSFLAKRLRPNLEEKRESLIDELKTLASNCEKSAEKLQAILDHLQSLNASSPALRQEVLASMKTFSKVLNEQPVVFNLCLPLCSRSTLAFLGGSQGASGNPTASNQTAYDRCRDFLQDILNALNLNAQSMKKAAADVSNDR
ncbi:MAG: motility associated factor glycosyltransferase family protein [Candidatus Omnitrophica bacterium]|nr:motility associated factor glycosyltransferase family protein [Candidatus Omnitrophota bacterium]